MSSASQRSSPTRMTSTAPTTPEEGERVMEKDNLCSMHSLLESLIRGASYLHEEEEGEDLAHRQRRRRTPKEGEAALETPTPAVTAQHGIDVTPTQHTTSDYFVQLHENRAKEASIKQDWKRESQESMLAQRERLSQSRKNSTTTATKESAPSLHADAMSSQSIETTTLLDSSESDNALERLHSHVKNETGAESDSQEGVHDHLFFKGDEQDEDVVSRISSRGSGKSRQSKPMSTEEKLQAIQIEFGSSECQSMIGEEERIVADEPCVLFRRVLIRGYAVLTNHRFCFIALVTNAQSNAGSAHSTHKSSHILKQGPATLHRPGLTKRKRKAWFVLSNNSITAYANSDELYEPLGGFRLSEISDVSSYKHHYRHSISFKAKGHTCYLELETEEAASSWHREIDVAKWRLTHDVDKIRISVPLVRIGNTRFEEYLSIFTLFHMDILDVDLYSSSGQRRHDRLERIQHKKAEAFHVTNEIVFGLPKTSSTILPELQSVLKKPTECRLMKDKSEWWSLPSPIVEIDGPKDSTDTQDDTDHNSKSMQKLIADEFSLTCGPEELQLVKADIVRTIPSGGILALSPRYLCFYRKRRLTGMADTRIKIPISDLKKVMPAKAFRWHYYGLRIQIQAHEDLLFELREEQHRDKARELIEDAIINSSNTLVAKDQSRRRKKSHLTSQGKALAAQADEATITLSANTINQIPRAVNVDTNKRPLRVNPIKIICLTIGSRGDVQPYIALCKELQKHNHECIIVSHDEYQEWVEGYGIGFRAAGGDPGALMKLSVENKMFSPQFFRESIGKFKHWLDELLRGIMETCWDADLIIESPSTFGGIHVAEAIGCYYMRAFTMPWTKTSAYPQAFSVPTVDMGPQYNAMSYTLFDQILWTASSGQINRWRKNMLHLASTDQAKLKINTVPFMYNFSPAVVPPPLDWGSLTAVTGYWNLQGEEGKDYEAPQDLVDFIAEAKRDEKKLCYIGFGSITMQDPRGTQKAIYEAVQKSDIRAIVSKGWSERMSAKEDKEGEEQEPLVVPKEVYSVESIPHDWLFPQIDIALHHGGAGTTGASLRAGLVTLIHPFFGDQYFWSGRVDKLGAGLRVKSLKVDAISEALTRARDDRVMREKAQVVGLSIRQEKGVENAVHFIYQNLSRSRRNKRVKDAERRKSSSSFTSSGHSQGHITTSEDSDTDEVESKVPRRSSLERHLSTSNSLLTLNGLKQAAYHPMDALHLSRSRSSVRREQKDKRTGSEPPPPKESSQANPDESRREVDTTSPPVEPSMSEGEEADTENATAEGMTTSPHQRGHSLLGLQYLPNLQRQITLPHMTIPSIMKLGMGNSESGLTEEEKENRRKENKEKHLSAKEEDQRRRKALLEIWREEKRWDLLGEEEVNDNNDDVVDDDDDEAGK